jgi:hypothetical protein
VAANRVARWSDDGESMLDFNIVNPLGAEEQLTDTARTPPL